MATGIVKWFDITKGYGFISPEDGAGDVFVHISSLERSGLNTLKESQRISYKLETNKQGKIFAENIEVMN